MTEASLASAERLFGQPLRVATAGIQGFADALRAQAVSVTEIDWSPPAEGDPAAVRILERIALDPRLAERIAAANQETVARIQAANPQIVDIVPAAEALGLEGRVILHSGPPIAWQCMCGPQRRGVCGAVRFEGWADTDAEADALIEQGVVRLAPCHRYRTVGPMTGIVSPSMPLWVARDETSGALAFATLNEGRGNTLWFGVCDPGTLERLRFLRDVLAPALRAALRQNGPLTVFDLVAQGLQMGDECHARHAATTSLLVQWLVPAMLDAGVAGETVSAFVRFARDNGHFYLNITMAAVKATMDAAHGVPWSTLVTAMSRNGVDFMIRVGGLGDDWIVAPVEPMDEAVYYTGFSVTDAAGDIGDSAIIETCGLGGMAIAAAPSVAPFVGGSVAHEVAAVESLRGIAEAEHARFRMATMDGAHPPLGIDLPRVVDSRLVPFITTGVLHETSATTGQIGTGVARAPPPGGLRSGSGGAGRDLETRARRSCAGGANPDRAGRPGHALARRSTPMSVLTAWRRQEERFYGAALNSPELYMVALRLARAIAEHLGEVADLDTLIARFDALDPCDVIPIADRLGMPQVALLDYELARAAGCVLRAREIAETQAAARAVCRLRTARETGEAWVVLAESRRERNGQEIFERVEARTADGAALILANDLDPERGWIYLLRTARVDLVTGLLVPASIAGTGRTTANTEE